MLNKSKIKNLINEKKFSLKSFSEKLGFTESGFLRMLDRDDMKLSTFILMCKTLNQNPLEILDSLDIKPNMEIELLKNEIEYLKKINEQAIQDKEFFKRLLEGRNQPQGQP